MAKRFAFGPFLLDTARGTLTRAGSAVAVGQRGLCLLHALLEAGGEPVSRAALMRAAWPGLVVEESNLPVQIAALRRIFAFESDDVAPVSIVTVPRLGYRLRGLVAIEDSELAPLGHAESQPRGRPGIAVLPFTHLGDDPAQEYLADAVTESLIAALVRFRWIPVLGRNASQTFKLAPIDARTACEELGVGYFVEGSVRRSGARFRIPARLVDARTGRCLWAERYDFADADLFDVQESLSQQVAGAIEPELLKNTGSDAASRRSGSVTAWELVAQGSWLFHHVTRDTHRKARERFLQARSVDAGLTEAHVWIGRVNAGRVAYGWSEQPSQDLREGVAAALEAVQLDEMNPYAHYALAIVSSYTDDLALALRSAEQARELSPCFALGHLVHGMASLYSGDSRAAIASLEQGLRLNRYDPQNFVWYDLLALAYLFAGNADDAWKHAIAALKVRPSWRAAMRTASAASATLGRAEEAARWREQWSRAPEAADAIQPLWQFNPRWAAEIARHVGEPG
ncbi:MAG: winged helix-turn-helix domain-containing protein [Burkholderiaceae bacterium]|nr:winged helix-turn-helix domain-containing protein [Burkholderiaceae bacterium]